MQLFVCFEHTESRHHLGKFAMVRIVYQHNVAQAVREMAQSILVFSMGVYAMLLHSVLPSPEHGPKIELRSTVFLLTIGVCTGVVVREVKWLLRKWRWNLNFRRDELKAEMKHYVSWTIVYLFVCLWIVVPIVFQFAAFRAGTVQYRPTILLSICIGIGVGIMTGDLFSAGFVAGLEWYGSTFSYEYSVYSSRLLLCFVIPAILLATTHAVRTGLALAGLDRSYFKYLKTVRWA